MTTDLGHAAQPPGFRGGRVPPGPALSANAIMAKAARMMMEWDKAVAQLAAVTSPVYADAVFNPFPVRIVMGEGVEPAWMAMRRLGAEERVAAFEWLDSHLDRVYAELGMVRDPHITRGAE